MASPRKSKIHTGVRIPPDIIKKMDHLIELEEYLNRSDIIVDALKLFFEKRENPTPNSVKEDFKAWVVSEDGETFMKGIIKKVKENR